MVDTFIEYNILIMSIAFMLLLYLAPIWWVLWKAGWRGYLKIKNPWLGGGVEMNTALLLSLGMNLVFPQVFGWVFERAREFTGDYRYGISMGVQWSFYVYLYPLAVLVFLGYLWKNRNRGSE